MGFNDDFKKYKSSGYYHGENFKAFKASENTIFQIKHGGILDQAFLLALRKSRSWAGFLVNFFTHFNIDTFIILLYILQNNTLRGGVMHFSSTQLKIIQSVIFISIFALLGLMLIPKNVILLWLFPVQFFITYIFFCRRQIRKINHLYVDKQSGAKWSVTFSEVFLGISLLLMGASLMLALIINSKLIAGLIILCPLWLTRTVIFLRNLPLEAMYPLKEVNVYEQSSYSTIQRYLD